MTSPSPTTGSAAANTRRVSPREPSNLTRRRSRFGGELAETDPENTDWQSALAVSYGKVGHVEGSQGRPAEELKAYKAALAIRERLAKSDPNNAC